MGIRPKEKSVANCGLDIMQPNPLIVRFLAQVGTFLPRRMRLTHTKRSGVAVTSQILCISITLNKG